MRKYILLSTLQSTGTWWAIDALRKHPEVGGFAHVENLMALQNVWALRDDWVGNPDGESIPSVEDSDYQPNDERVILLYEHYNSPAPAFYRWRPQTPSEYLMSVLPTLSTLRDPLLCMIRAWHREPPLYPYDWLMDAWEHVAKRGDTLGVKFWRMEPFDRQGFRAALEGVGLSIPGLWWKGLETEVRINYTPGECDLRHDYIHRDAVAIEKKLPKPWRRLREAEPVLRPFLETYGFENLLWWS